MRATARSLWNSARTIVPSRTVHTAALLIATSWPFAFGGSTGLVDVGDGNAHDQTSHPDVDPSLSLPNVTGDANRPSLLEDHSKHNSVAEVVGLLKLVLQFLIHAEPALNEGTNRRLAFEDVPQRPPLKDRIHSKAAHHRSDITSIRSLTLPAHTLHQVGGRGLLGHRLRPFLREAFGGTAGLVDVSIGRVAHDQTVFHSATAA